MSERRADFLAKVEAERIRQVNMPGSEYDIRNGPNDWAAIAMHYLADEVRRGANVPKAGDFEDALVKAAAVIAAAYEHVSVMENKGSLR